MTNFALNFLACLLASSLVFSVLEYRRNRAVRQLREEIDALEREMGPAGERKRTNDVRTMWD